jgi:type IV pilus assembly protein PilW
MVALALGTLLIAGAVQIFVEGQRAYRTNERIAELQERARHALALMELDLRMAGYWGLSSRGERIENTAGPGASLPEALVAAASGINACGPNWAIHVSQHIGAADNRYDLNCAAYNRHPQTDSDVLIVRRASNPVSGPPTTPRLRIIANRSQGQVVIAPCNDFSNSACSRTPPPLPEFAGALVHDLLVHAYYISRDSTGVNALPSLRRKRLVGGAGGATIQDEEIISGVENLQVQLGIGSAAGDVPVQFTDPGAVDFSDALRPIVAVRLWLLIRADTAEPGFMDQSSREFPPGRLVPAPGDAIRRLLVSTTVYLRNTRS